ncbi:MFS transporter [Planobispora longispora]|nr:MFS transporter [Planobispora longispora]
MRTGETGAGMWRDRSFRLFLGADAISQFGTQVTIVALSLVAVLALDASPFEVGLVTAAETAAFLVLGLPAGVWVDRLRRRPILIWSDLLRAAALASVPLAVALDALTLPQLYLVALLMGLGTVFFDVAHMSFLPSLVGRDDLLRGNGVLETMRSTAVLSGPALGGWLVHAVTAPIALLADAVSYLVSALLLGGVRAEEAPAPAAERRSLREEIAEGVRYVVDHPMLRRLAMVGAVTMLSNGVWFVAQPFFLLRTLGVSPGLYGLLLTGAPVGGLIGAALAPRLAARYGTGRAMCGGAVLASAAPLLVPLAAGGWRLALYPLGCLLLGVGGSVYNVNQLSYRQRITPERLLGRMNASMRFLMWGAAPAGGLLGGTLGTWFDAHAILWVAVCGFFLAHLPVLTCRAILRL